MIPPRSALRVFWALHKGIDRLSGGRLSTIRPTDHRVGTLFLLTTGRTTALERRNGLYYIEDGSRYVVVASNAGADHDPRWWLNLQANPNAAVEISGRRLAIQGRAATDPERERLWPELVRRHATYAEYARTATRTIPIVILEPMEVSPRPS